MNTADLEARIDAYLDGTISAPDQAELDRALCAEPVAARRFVEATADEAMLRMLLGAAGLVAVGPAQHAPSPAGPRTDRPLRLSRRGPLLPAPHRAVRRWGRWVTALAAGILIAVAVVQRERWRAWLPGPAHAEVAVLESAAGRVLKQSGSALETAPGSGERFAPGEWVRTVGPDSLAVLQFPGVMRLELGPDTRVRVGTTGPADPPPTDAATRAFAAAGTLSVDVLRTDARRPTTLTSPHARIAALGTRFKLDVSAPATEIELTSGRLEVSNGRTGESRLLAAGYAARVDERAISVRPLPGGPTGPALGAVPLAGLAIRLDPAALGMLRDGAPVAIWPDTSGNGHDAAQGAGERRPRYRARGFGDRPVVSFDGVDDFLIGSAPRGFHDCTLVLVFAPVTIEHPGGVFGLTGPGGAGWESYTDYANPDALSLAEKEGEFGDLHLCRDSERDHTSPANLAIYADVPRGLVILTVTLRQGLAELRVNGGSPVTDRYADTNPIESTRYRLGCRRVRAGEQSFNRMDLAELLFYTRALGEPERAGVERILSRKHGIALRLAARAQRP
ncbi:MAG: FecR domain-containing protein [Kiritimatiellae bacterium]|nr:FecR domain-containing protein [Kiritimatiellia bacterium]